VVLKDKKEVLPQTKASDQDDKRGNQPAAQTQTPQYHPVQRGSLRPVERKDIHRARVLRQRVTAQYLERQVDPAR